MFISTKRSVALVLVVSFFRYSSKSQKKSEPNCVQPLRIHENNDSAVTQKTHITK